MEKSIFFARNPCNMIKFSFEYITKLLKYDKIDKLERVINVGRFLEHYYPGSLELFLFLTDYKTSLPE